MAYIKKTVIAGKTTEIKLYHTGKQRPKGEPRRKKTKPTSDEMKEVNFKNAENELRWLMCENFVGGEDLHLILKYNGKVNHVLTAEEMERDIHRFIRLMRTQLRNQGKELKYIFVYGIGKRKSRHFHMVINCSDVRLIQKCWSNTTENAGRVSYEIMYDDGDFSRLAWYFIEHSRITFEALHKWTGQRYHPSRNLRKPVIKREEVTRSSTFRNLPHVPDGYELIDKYVKSGFDVFGYRYFEYRIRKIE
ncbi:MAG: hypothetical protein NC122_10665 [Faecalibacterium sp.]|nr:hypothetical protein [Ruminococcus sp.]MCM1393180.1 hypothetical protein [Ruminococcus sp.]MCM1486652.1 hypothetical protein [Faecalibacterium sp.]